MSNNNAEQFCPVCQIRQDGNGVFYWSNTGEVADTDKVYTRVCKYAKSSGKSGCINTVGKEDPAKGWLDFE